MTMIEVGCCYAAKRVEHGTNSKGPWELFIVQREGRGQPKICLFPTNCPSGIMSNGMFRLDDIRSVQHRKIKTSKGKWVMGNVVVRGHITPIKNLEEVPDMYKPEEGTQFPSLEEIFGIDE